MHGTFALGIPFFAGAPDTNVEEVPEGSLVGADVDRVHFVEDPRKDADVGNASGDPLVDTGGDGGYATEDPLVDADVENARGDPHMEEAAENMPEDPLVDADGAGEYAAEGSGTDAEFVSDSNVPVDAEKVPESALGAEAHPE